MLFLCLPWARKFNRAVAQIVEIAAELLQQKGNAEEPGHRLERAPDIALRDNQRRNHRPKSLRQTKSKAEPGGRQRRNRQAGDLRQMCAVGGELGFERGDGHKAFESA